MTSPIFLNVAQVVTNLTPGVLGAPVAHRIAVWVAGCSLGRLGTCAGCMSTDWHAEGAGQPIPVAALVQLADTRQQCGGLVVSGGEPTDQLVGILALLNGYKAIYPHAPVLLYSGRGEAWLRRHAEGLFSLTDAVVAGPYLQHRRSTSMAGSDNQRVLINTALGAQVFGNWSEFLPRLQLLPAPGGHARLIGIPDHAARQRLQAAGLWPEITLTE